MDNQQITTNFLTIGIPTYNRAGQLENLLNSLVLLTIPWLEEGIVRILVSDNDSIDNTQEMLKNHRLSNYIDYYRNNENIGPSENALKIIQTFESDYLIIICDDDIFLADNLSEIINKLWREKPDYAVVNLIGPNGATVIHGKGDDKDINWLLLSQNAVADGGLGYVGSVILGKKVKTFSQKDGILFESMWYTLKLFFRIYSSSLKGILILTPPIIRIVGPYSCGKIEESFAIHVVDRLRGIHNLYNQGIIKQTHYDIIVNQFLSRVGYQSLFPFLFGQFPQKTKQVINYLLKHYPNNISILNKIMLLFMSKTPHVFHKLLRPLSIIFLYHIYYRYFSLKFLNLFRKTKRKDDFHAFLSKNAPEPTWKFNWEEIAD